MNKKLFSFFLSLLFVLQVLSGGSVFAAENVNISKYSAGWYDGELSVFSNRPSSDVFSEPSYGLEILDISDDSVTFFVESVGRNGSPIYITDQITAVVEDDTARFEWTDSWGNKGTGVLTFGAACLNLSMTETESDELNRSTLAMESIDLYSRESRDLADVTGVYQGSYYGRQGETALTLTVFETNGKYQALFDFYNLPGRSNAEEGCYLMDVSSAEDGIHFEAKTWMQKPSSYHLVDLQGTLSGNVLSGASPTEFSVTRIADAPEQVIPSNAVSFAGHSYMLFDSDMDWQEAKACCEELGGHLAAITSAEENEFLYSYISGLDYGSVVFGFSDEATEGSWQWVTGEQPVYLNWSDGEPNNQGKYEHYGMYYEKNKDGRWNDGSGGTCPFLCEWDVLLPNTDISDVVYMEELEPIDSDRYTGNQGDSFIDTIGRRNGSTDVDGNTWQHGLTAWVARWNYTDEISWVWNTYDLGGNYSTLDGDIVLIESHNEDDFETEIEITGDGRVLYTKILTPETLPVRGLHIDVSGVQELTISMQDLRSVSGGTAFGLADFRLSRSGASVQTDSGAPSDWAKEEIDTARENGLIPSELDRDYQSNITRREFCLLAAALLKAKTGAETDEILDKNRLKTDTNVFSDTSDKAVLAMDALGIVSGDGDGSFRPNSTITREEAAAMLTRLAKVLNGELPSDAALSFADAAQVSDWAYYPVMFVSNTEDKESGNMVMLGTGDNCFAPSGTYTREQAFLSFGRLYGALEDCEPDDIRLENAVSAENIEISSELGYLTGVYNLAGDGKRALWLKSEEGKEYSDTIVVKEDGQRMSADEFEMWLRPMEGNELPVRLEDGATVTAFQAGPAVLTVQSPVTGTIWESFYVYACDITSKFLLGTNGQMPVREINRLPANFYCAGMYVDSYDAQQVGGEWQVTMNVYNSTAIYGAVDIYDVQGNYLRSERIKKHPTLPDGIVDTLANGWGVIADMFAGEALTYRQDSSATESNLSFRVPEGGMLIFSNNVNESPGAAVFNFTDLFVEGISAVVKSINMTKADANKVSESFSAALLDALKEKCADPTEEGMKSVIQWANSNYDTVSVTELLDTIVNDGINGLNNLGIDAVQIFMKCAGDILSDSIIGTLESAFENAAGPAGMVLKGMFYLTDVGNYIVQLDHYKEAGQTPQLHVIYPAGVKYLDDGRVIVDSIRVS